MEHNHTFFHISLIWMNSCPLSLTLPQGHWKEEIGRNEPDSWNIFYFKCMVISCMHRVLEKWHAELIFCSPEHHVYLKKSSGTWHQGLGVYRYIYLYSATRKINFKKKILFSILILCGCVLEEGSLSIKKKQFNIFSGSLFFLNTIFPALFYHCL